jgi:hypothetical protein
MVLHVAEQQKLHFLTFDFATYTPFSYDNLYILHCDIWGWPGQGVPLLQDAFLLFWTLKH